MTGTTKRKFCFSPDLKRTIEWYVWLEKISNTTFLPLHVCRDEILVMKGGAGSGKSECAALKVLDRAANEPGHRFLVARKFKNTIRESCFKLLKVRAFQHFADKVAKVNETNMTITFVNGSEIICSGLDDTEKLKSIFEITDIWVEEASEIAEADFHQLETRMRGKSPYYRQMILTFNPVSISHWLKKLFFDRKYPKTYVHESTYKDNRFLDRDYIEKLEAFKDIDEYYYTVYCLGHWGSVFRSIFPTAAITARLAQLQNPMRLGFFEGKDFVEDKDGFIKIYAEPKKGRPYVIGADTAGEGSDFFAAHVIDNVTGEQVAVLHAQIDETVFPEQLMALGYMYNTALIAVECNFSTYTVRELERAKYKKQYVRRSEDRYTHKSKHQYGFETNKLTRPLIISELVKTVRQSADFINNKATLEEMLTFVRNEKLRAEAAEGTHDDLVMSLAIALHVREAQSTVDEVEPQVWTPAMRADYEDATPEERLEMIKLYGRPKPRRNSRRR